MDDLALQSRFEALAKALNRIDKKADFILKHLNLEYHDATEEIPLPSVVELIRKNQMLAAITEYRRIKGSSLGEAKAAVEALQIKLQTGG